MQLTAQGLLAINTPKGWERAQGPGLLFFLRKNDKQETAPVWIYVNTFDCPSKSKSEHQSDFQACVASDVAGFRDRFKQAKVRLETPVELSAAHVDAVAYTFESGEEHNAFERVVYVPDVNQVLILDLSATNAASFQEALPTFNDFVQSYRGSIQPGSPDK